MSVEFIGHHGTSSEKCKKIKKEGFIPSKWGWLGSGVYFFEDDDKLARSWARYKYEKGKIEVIECVIKTEQKKLLDVSNPKNEKTIKVNEFKEYFLKKGLEKNKIIDMSDEEFDNKILNLICNKDGYDVVRNFTHTITSNDRIYHKKNSNIPNGVELCVKNKNCIFLSDK